MTLDIEARRELDAQRQRPIDTSKVTRVTVVSETGREYEGWNLFKEGAVLHLQDDGRTLKIFPKGYGYDE